MKRDEFTTAYLTAALWTSTDETNPEQGGAPLDQNYSIEDIDAATLDEMTADCEKFQALLGKLIDDMNVKYRGGAAYSCEERAGHDFWLTRNGHGAGFWDGDWTEPAATKLTDAATAFGEYDITASGNGGSVTKL